MNGKERAALERLLEIAEHDSGGSRRVADFLLSWWNPVACGKFDPTDTWYLNQAVCDDILLVLALLMRVRIYPDSLGYGVAFRRIQLLWRDPAPGSVAASRG
jgi:hypothetical protein